MDSKSHQINVGYFRSSYLKISIGGQYQFHQAGTTNDNPVIPNQNETITESPSVGTFFEDNGTFKVSLEFKKDLKYKQAYSLGFEFDNIEIDNTEYGTEIFFGDKLTINSFVPYFCYGKYINDYYFFGKIGIPLKIYQGEADINGYDIKNNYKNSIGLRLGSGFDLKFTKSLSLSFGTDIDFGMVKRKNVEASSEDEQFIELIAEGDDLEDTQIVVYALISYQFNFKQRSDRK